MQRQRGRRARHALGAGQERFEMLLEPLVAQLEVLLGDYEARVEELLAPTVAQLAVRRPK